MALLGRARPGRVGRPAGRGDGHRRSPPVGPGSYDRAVAVQQDLPLGSEFPPPSRDQWLALVDKVLAGAPFDRKLVSRTPDGLRVEPLYTAADVPAGDPAGLPGLAPFTRGGDPGRRVSDGWDIRQLYAQPDLAEANAAILSDLERGVTSLVLHLGPGGLPVSSVDDLAAVLDGVLLDLAPVILDAAVLAGTTTTGTGAEGVDAVTAAGWLRELWGRQQVPPSAALGQLGIDPLATAARTGTAARLDDLVSLVRDLHATHPQVRVGRVDATVYADAGASPAQELAFALATGVAYLRALLAAGIDIDTACGQLVFQLSATAEQFGTMAKLRAARRCWARVAEASGASPAARAARIDAVTASAMLSQRDPWVNVLRSTLATFAAGAAGADSVTVLPFDQAVGVPDELGRRLARNTQMILLEETNLARVLDPGGGSYFVEHLTEELAQEAWRRFQAIEAAGGMAAVLASGQAAAEVEASWRATLKSVATRRQPLTGVSEFPDVAEPRLARRPWPAAVADGPFPLRRRSAPFEALRDAADQAEPTPTIFLANLGPIAVHTARAGFARNLFETGGVRTVDNEGFDDADQVASAFTASGARLAILCSSDAVYAERAADTARALKATGAVRVYLAGAPGDARDAYEAAGIDEFVSVGTDALDVLRRALDTLGVTP